MKAKKSAISENVSPQDIEAYLSKVPEPAQATLRAVREAIRKVAPAEAEEKFSYGVPAFRLPKGSLAGYAAGKEFCSYYPMSGRVITKLARELKGYATTSGSIHFPLDEPLPDSLVQKLVAARLAELEKKA